MASITDPVASTHYVIPQFGHRSIDFSNHHHLLITTDREVCGWHKNGIMRYFWLKRGGIVSAKEARDGSGLLAIADGWVVLLLDRNRDVTKRWGLGKARARHSRSNDTSDGPEEHMVQGTLLHFAGHEMFYSTPLDHKIVRYSTSADRIIGYSCTHPSSPTVLAVSANARYMITASATPRTIILEDLVSDYPAVHFQPSASDAIVTASQFHPDREDIFLLAYADGTTSIHAAARFMLTRDLAGGTDGSMGHLKRASRNSYAPNEGTSSSRTEKYQSSKTLNRGIVAAAFMGGHKLRVVTLAGDGKCRIVDYERGADILRTWKLNTSCTSMSVFPLESDKDNTAETYLRHIIAIGRADGFVNLYNELGLLWEERLVKRHCPILGLDWFLDFGARIPASDRVSQALPEDNASHFDGNSITTPESRLERSIPQLLAPTQSPQLATSPAASQRPSFRRQPASAKQDASATTFKEELLATETRDVRQMPGGWISSASSFYGPPSVATDKSEKALEQTPDKSEKDFEQTPIEVVSQNVGVKRGVATASVQSPTPRPQRQRGAPFRTRPLRPQPPPSDSRFESAPSHASPKGAPSLGSSPLDSFPMGSSLPPPLLSPKVDIPDMRHDSTKPSARPKPADRSGDGLDLVTTKRPTIHLDVSRGTGKTVRGPYLPPRAARVSDDSEAWWVTADESPSSHKTKGKARALSTVQQSFEAPTTATSASSLDKPLPPPPLLPLEQRFTYTYAGAQPLSPPLSPPIPPRVASRSPTKPLPPSPAKADTRSSRLNTLSPRPLEPLSPILALKPLPKLPPLHGEMQPLTGCSCDCADVVREEMAVLRGEVASLRKTIWVFGSGVGWERLKGSLWEGLGEVGLDGVRGGV